MSYSKDFLEELKAAEELEQRGYRRTVCHECNGDGGEKLKVIRIPCAYCMGRGYRWMKQPTESQ